MSIASAIQTKQQQVAAAYTACNSKSATMPQTQNLTNLATCISSIPSGGGSSGKYQLLQRVEDDNGNEIGTVSGFFTDANDVEYAVVCLDAQYRLSTYESGGQWSDSNGAVTDLPQYNALNPNAYEAKETATFNTQKILDWCSANNHSSSACSHCRSKNFTIDGTVYYGQLPNIVELIDIYKHQTSINAVDTSASSNPQEVLSFNDNILSSTQCNLSDAWMFDNNAYITTASKAYWCFVTPVLEIPNA